MILPTAFDQVLPRDVKAMGLDLMIVACGYEKRATFVAEYIGAAARKRVSVAFVEHRQHPRRVANEQALADLGYESHTCSGDDHRQVVRALPGDLGTPGCLRIGIDISSMTRAWYWGLTKAVSQLRTQSPVEVFYFYTPARFASPQRSRIPPKMFGPIPGLSNGLELPDRDISLIIGLGYETDKALGLVEYLEPRNTWLFYTDPAADDRFTEQVKHANEILFHQVDAENVVKYQFDDLTLSLAGLDSLVRGLIRNSRVLIAPLGPKPFGLLAFLLSLVHPEVDVWRVSAGASAAPQARTPTGKILVGRVVFAGPGVSQVERGQSALDAI